MEAIALYDFAATAEDELSFKKGQILQVLLSDEDAYWHKAQIGHIIGFVPKNYIQMSPCDWFYGHFSRSNADMFLLRENQDGSFLIRNSETTNEAGSYSLSVKHGDAVQHYKILKDINAKYFIWQQKFTCLNELVEHYRHVSISLDVDLRLVDMPRLHCFCRALHSFLAQSEGELSLRKGDIVQVNDLSDSHWWRGVVNGRMGYFPSRFVEIIE